MFLLFILKTNTRIFNVFIYKNKFPKRFYRKYLESYRNVFPVSFMFSRAEKVS